MRPGSRCATAGFSARPGAPGRGNDQPTEDDAMGIAALSRIAALMRLVLITLFTILLLLPLGCGGFRFPTLMTIRPASGLASTTPQLDGHWPGNLIIGPYPNDPGAT